ncbi:MAG: PAS domain S-box protein [Desulfobacter sp.]|nr:MAG: PAS domain S-box protein [Desulfobacter sp.]
MNRFWTYIRYSLVSKLVIIVGLTVVLSISAWAWVNITNLKAQNMKTLTASTDRLSNSIKLGTHYAMMLNSRDDITQIINNIASQPGIENIRIYNKDGQIKFTNHGDEIDEIVDIKAVACDICHKYDSPPDRISLEERVRYFQAPDGTRQMGVVQPICNEPGCASGDCHFHPEHQRILGTLDVVVSLEGAHRQALKMERGSILLTLFTILTISVILFFSILQFVKKPIIRLIDGTRQIAKGDYDVRIKTGRDYEIDQLGRAIEQMGHEIGHNQAELRKQKDEYQDLFDKAPCMIAIQDKNYRLLRYNRVFKERFDPKPGSLCYHAYKGRDEKCEDCPVEKTFRDGRSHYGEAEGMGRDGESTHWIFITAPVRDQAGNITAAMEMSIDITRRRRLERDLQRSEEKYHAIFNNIHNPVFVVRRDDFRILDCNIKAVEVYGARKSAFLNRPFSQFFRPEERHSLEARVRSRQEISKVKHVNARGQVIDVDMWVSPSEYSGKRVFLITVNDITQRLETEQHLLHASKMATLGEMSTGIAHELNQPLSVIKSSSSFCLKKIRQKEELEWGILANLMSKIDANVDRAEKIIHHMRQFARKSEVRLVPVQINDVLQRTFEMFNQQLKIHGIDVGWEKKEDLPLILGDPDRLEQVFINLIMNARDAIEAKWATHGQSSGDGDAITIETRVRGEGDEGAAGSLVIEVKDTGPGIPEAVEERLFEPFFTTKEVGKGTGLGLSISYGIIKDCGGSIRTGRKKKGEGAVFVISFPVPRNLEDKIVYT